MLLHWAPAMSPWLVSSAAVLRRPFPAQLVGGGGSGRLGQISRAGPSAVPTSLQSSVTGLAPNPRAPSLGKRLSSVDPYPGLEGGGGGVIDPAGEAACRRLNCCSSCSSHAARHC